MRKILKAHKEFTIPPLSLQEETILLKYKVANRLERVRDQHRELQEIMNDDELMTLMNLTYLRDNPSLYSRFEESSHLPLLKLTLQYSAENIPETVDIHTFVEVRCSFP
jgi:hypothetical protein